MLYKLLLKTLVLAKVAYTTTSTSYIKTFPITITIIHY